MNSIAERILEEHGKLYSTHDEEGRGRLNIVLITVLLLVVLSLLLLVTLIIHSGFVYEPLDDIKTCTSVHCVNLAMSVLQSVNLSVDPCEDFYTFACGTWIHNKIKRGIETSVFEELQKSSIKSLMEILDSYGTMNDLPRPSEIALSAYRNCVNFKILEPFHFDWLNSFLNRGGGWPLIDDKWKESEYDWIFSLAFAIRNMDILSILPISVSYDSNDTSKNIIIIGQFLEDDEPSISQMINYVTAVAVHFNTLGYTSIMEDIDMILELERNISSMSQDMSSLANEYKCITVKELQNLIPTIDWLKLIQFLTNDSLVPRNETVTLEERVVIKGEKFLAEFGNMMNNGTIPLRVFANLIGSKIISKFFVSFLASFQTSLSIERSAEADYYSRSERAELCIAQLSELLTFALDHIYIRFQKTEEINAKVMIPYLFKAFRLLIYKSKWLDEETKNNIIVKLDKLLPVVNYPAWITNKDKLNAFYNELPEMTNNPLENFANLHYYTFNQSVILLRKRNHRDGWPPALRKSASTFGAYYVTEVNSIVIPLAFHSAPNFHLRHPWYMNYGAMGFGIGHEITHAFDNVGSHRDGEGRLRNWWTKRTKAEFDHRSKCFVNTYSKYGLIGNSTLSENMADSGGLRQAYLAYRLWEKDHAHEVRLPGLENLTARQLFFVSYAMNWCDSKSPSTEKELLLNEDHPPNRFRVLGTISNTKEFSKVFNCKPNSKMNPADKCSIW